MARSPLRPTPVALFFVTLAAIAAAPAFAQDAAPAVPAPVFSARKVFLMLFLMLGPIKILVPFVQMTGASDARFRAQLATRAILFSAAALVLAGFAGRQMIRNFDISLPVLALTGGLILFLVALKTVLDQSVSRQRPTELPTGPHLALSPLAFPVIVTPYGIAAVIVFASLAQGDPRTELLLWSIVLAILAMDWLAMVFAARILTWIGTPLQIAAVVLGVTQIALGLQVMLHSLAMIGVFTERPY